MIKKEYIAPFEFGKFNFIGADLYSYQRQCLLIEKFSGTTFFTDQSLIKHIKSKKIDDKLCFKLLQRGLIQTKESLPRYCDIKSFHKPTLMLIELTKECNLRCKYCFRDFSPLPPLQNSTEKQEVISDKTIEEICKYIANYFFKNKMKVITIQVWGGEPLLYIDKIVHIRKVINSLNVNARIVVQTNGTLITPIIAEKIAKNHIHVGISIDGPKKLQDLQRVNILGQSAYDKVLEGIKALRAVNRDFGVIPVITNNSIDMIEDILDFFVKDLRLDSVKFNIVHAKSNLPYDMGFDEKKSKDFSERLINKLISLNKEGYPIIERSIQTRIENLLIDSNGGFCKAKGCQYGKYMAGFGLDGNIYPCELMGFPEECVGNVKENSDLSELLTTAFEKQKSFIKSPDSDHECTKCSFWAGCYGGCASAVKYGCNDAIKTDTALCSVNKCIYPKLIELLFTNPKNLELLYGGEIKILNN